MEAIMSPKNKALFLEITEAAGHYPLRFPASVKNVSGKMVTLEVARPWPGIMWEDLQGREVTLYLGAEPEEEILMTSGSVIRVRCAGDRLSRVTLLMELVEAAVEMQTALAQQMHHSPRDLKELWERWEQVQAKPPSIWEENKAYLGGLAVLVAGTALQFASPNSLRLFGYFLMFCGSLAIGGRSLQSLRQKRLAS